MAFIGAIIFAVFSTSPGIEGFTANAELFALLPLTVSAFFTWRKKWFWAGIWAGIAVTIKPIGLSGFLLSAAWVFYSRAGLKSFFKLIIGVAVAPSLCLIHGYLIDWDAFLYSFIENRLLRGSPVAFGLKEQALLFYKSSVQVLPVLLFPLLLTGWSLIQKSKPIKIFFLFWILSSFFGMAMGGLWHWHYYMQLIPPPEKYATREEFLQTLINSGYKQVEYIGPYSIYEPTDMNKEE